MHRLQVYLPHPTMEWLRAEAERRGITVAELIRRILDATREGE